MGLINHNNHNLGTHNDKVREVMRDGADREDKKKRTANSERKLRPPAGPVARKGRENRDYR